MPPPLTLLVPETVGVLPAVWGVALPAIGLAGSVLLWTFITSLVLGLATLAVLAARQAREAREQAAAAGRQARLLLTLHERDRQRLAKALHDGPVQDLLAMGMEASVAAHLGGGPVQETTSDVAHVIHDLRAVSESLRPPALGSFGLGAAVTAHVDRYRDRHPGISVSLDLDDDDLDLRTRLALFRIVQEALENAARHGRPLRIDVGLSVSGAGATLTVRDDGTGYEVPEDATVFAASGRYGVIGMLAQAESVGAEVHVESAPGRTVVHVSAPSEPPHWP